MRNGSYRAIWIVWTFYLSITSHKDFRDFFRITPYIRDHQTLEPAATSGIDCSTVNPLNEIQRTLDGTCNELNFPGMGSVGTRFKRLNGRVVRRSIDEFAVEPENETLLEPNPRTVARNLLFPNTDYPKEEASHLNMLTAAWAQFLANDMMYHGEVQTDSTIDIPLETDDPLYEAGVNEIYRVFRTREDATSFPEDVDRPTTWQNMVTAWFDASQMYGTSFAENIAVRDPANPAKLLLNENFSLPLDSSSEEISGFTKNWWLGSSLLTNLFAREHNYYVDVLRNVFFPLAQVADPGDEVVYGFARLMISGLIAKITTVEWSPAVLGNEIGDNLMNFDWYGLDWVDWGLNRNKENGYNLFLEFFDQYDPNGFPLPSRMEEPTAGLLSYERHEDIRREWFSQLETSEFQIKGGAQITNDNHNQVEEFTHIFRFHSMLPEEFTFNCIPNIDQWTRLDGAENFNDVCIAEEDFNINNLNTGCFENTVEMSSLLGHENTLKWRQEYSFDDVVYSFGTNSPTYMDLFSYTPAMTEYADPDTGTIIDLATLDVIRQRERGVHRYNLIREAVGFDKLTSFSDLTNDEELIKIVNETYFECGGIDCIDLTVGLLLENQGGLRNPKGWLFGETTWALFSWFTRQRLKADRFYTDNWDDATYTRFGLLWIENNALADVIVRHYPTLRPFIPENAFSTWFDGICDPSDEYTPTPTMAPTVSCPEWCRRCRWRVWRKLDECSGCKRGRRRGHRRNSSFLASDDKNVSLTWVFVIFFSVVLITAGIIWYFWKRNQVQKELDKVAQVVKKSDTFNAPNFDE